MSRNQDQIMASSLARGIMDDYAARRPLAKEHHARAAACMPGGDTRTSTFYRPFPAYMDHGRGCHLWDVDGNQYIDCQNNYTTLIHGHAYQPVIEALKAQADKGSVLGGAAENQYRLAELLCGRIPAMDRVRFCNSGTEATLFAVRAARLATGRDVIIKMDGGYHGSHDLVEVSIHPDPKARGPVEPHLEAGAPQSVLADVRLAPFNDLKAVAEILAREANDIAAILVEPQLGSAGQVAPLQGYLKGLRKLADEYGVLLVFDEVMTLRTSLGGYQMFAEVEPDITAMAKIIGGGLPVGAFGGRAEIMELFNPDQPNPVTHSGTFNGNPMTMAAGLAAMEGYGQAEVDHLFNLGDRLRTGLEDVFQSGGYKASVTGTGSLLQVHWLPGPVINARQAARAKAEMGPLAGLLHLELMNRGVFIASRGMFVLSTPMRDSDVDFVVEAFRDALDKLEPLLEEFHPALLA